VGQVHFRSVYGRRRAAQVTRVGRAGAKRTPAPAEAERTPDRVARLECTHCGSRMSSTAAADGGAYYRCPRCDRTYASCYPEVIDRAAGARRPASEASTRPDPRFDEVKRRLEAWLRRLDEQDPYFVLGVRPGATMEQVRARYRELALVHHPDRGGDANRMRRILRAYDQIRVLLATGRAPRGPQRRIAGPVGED